ncbi:MAG: hypothetical protein R3200_17325, partial [Xanthomonadales bacterium]|nr:hypothetical protein [Xanthomonadales bacterium]
MRHRPWIIALLTAALGGCSPDPVGEVKETTSLCASEQPFSAIVDTNISNPNYEIVSERDGQIEVAIAGAVAYLGRPVRIEVSVEDDTPTDFTVIASDLDPLRSETLRDRFCAGELPLADEFGARASIAARVDRARQSHGAIARMILIEEQSPDEVAN